MLLERDNVTPDKDDSYGQIPLFFPPRSRHEGMVETLLGQDDFNPNKPAIGS